MKKGIWVAALLSIAPLMGCAQFTPVENPNKPITVTVNAAGKTQSQLYTAARLWFTTIHVHSNPFDGGEIINDDKKTAFIAQVSSANMPCEGIDCQMNTVKYALLSYKLRIDTKDGQVKITYTDFVKTEAPDVDRNGIPYGPRRVHAIQFQSDLDAVQKGVIVWGKELIVYINKKPEDLPSVNE